MRRRENKMKYIIYDTTSNQFADYATTKEEATAKTVNLMRSTGCSADFCEFGDTKKLGVKMPKFFMVCGTNVKWTHPVVRRYDGNWGRMKSELIDSVDAFQNVTVMDTLGNVVYEYQRYNLDPTDPNYSEEEAKKPIHFHLTSGKQIAFHPLRPITEADKNIVKRAWGQSCYWNQPLEL